MSKTVIITGSAGLIGSEAVKFFCERDFKVVGVDNNSRAYFFGPEASTDWNRKRLEKQFKNYKHFQTDIRNQDAIEKIFQDNKVDLVIHTAAQPSHDWAAKEPITDFTINANGTLIMLEATRKYASESVFIFTSTNKVYGDTPNFLPLVEKETRWELDPKHKYAKHGIDESMSIDNSTHSIFGVSKASADLMVQEYGKYFGMKTGIFRGGCLTGPAHSSAQLHGFLAYLVSAVAAGKHYSVFGYKGKQVRDNIHAYDVVNAFYHFYLNPKPGEVYNIGGSRHSNTSVLEAISDIEKILGKKAKYDIKEENRIGDHIWYISDVSKLQRDFPEWKYTYTKESLLEELCRFAVTDKR